MLGPQTCGQLFHRYKRKENQKSGPGPNASGPVALAQPLRRFDSRAPANTTLQAVSCFPPDKTSIGSIHQKGPVATSMTPGDLGPVSCSCKTRSFRPLRHQAKLGGTLAHEVGRRGPRSRADNAAYPAPIPSTSGQNMKFQAWTKHFIYGPLLAT